MKSITYFGIIRSITSWSKVAREMIAALISLGVDVSIYERKGFLFDDSFPLDYSIKSRITHTLQGKTICTFEHPTTYRYMPVHSYKMGILVYEFSHAPQQWVEHINRYLDILVVPSQFCRDIFIRSGVPEQRIRTLRFGFNPQFYYPRKQPKKPGTPYTFLCNAAPHKREGIDLLLRCFTNVFTKNDNVHLILKLSYIPGKNPKPFEYSTILQEINTFRKKQQAPPITVISKQLTEQQMGDLYRKSDCYFSLTRGEGFGLCFLEALASGLSIACIPWGGQCDFLNDNNATFIKYTLTSLAGQEYEPVGRPADIALPDSAHAQEVMYQIYQNRLQKNNENIPQGIDLKHYWWQTIVKELVG